MSEHRIILPRVAETVDESYVAEFLVNAGDAVTAGQAILRVETDKAIVEIPSDIAGVLSSWLVEIDQEIATGTEIAIVEV